MNYSEFMAEIERMNSRVRCPICGEINKDDNVCDACGTNIYELNEALSGVTNGL